jgi:squalene-hopene/tetraprenyl-beta-curcumene cyclase
MFRNIICSLTLVTMLTSAAVAAPPQGIDRAAYERTVTKAVNFLRVKGASADGSYSGFSGIGVTALCTTALMRNGVPQTDPGVAKSLQYLKGFVQADGGIYQPGSLYRNYETCLAILCLTEANRNDEYSTLIARADAFVKGIQWDESEGKEKSDLGYGGAGYGKHKRPDLSNTSFLIDALKAAGNDADSEAVQRALAFVSRCQNLESEHNTTSFATKNEDGGFYYTIAAGGSSQAGETPNGGLRSYGSMTYAGLKSLLYAGVDRDDPRVKAAKTWVQKHYDLKTNPGLGNAGLYYYYHLMAKSLSAVGDRELISADGVRHNWRSELLTELASKQQPDGSWINENDRWLEGDANLVTGYALLALAYCGN